MKLLLLSLLPTTEDYGIKYIHAYLLSKGHDSSIVYLPRHSQETVSAVEAFVEASKPDAVGCGYMTYDAPFAHKIERALKQRFPSMLLIAGGIHPTLNPEECLECADIVCIGESEETVLEIADNVDNGVPLTGIRNIAFRENGVVVRNPLRPLIEDLDRLPFPEHLPPRAYVFHKGRIAVLRPDLFRQYTRYDGMAYNLISSRGCPLSCSYCCNSALARIYDAKKIRKRSPENVIRELRDVTEKFPGIILVNIQDDCFLAQTSAWHREFAEGYKKDIARPFIIRSTPLHVTEEKIEILKDAGLSWIMMGLQSGSEKTNRDIFLRRVSNEKFLDATRIVKKYGISGYFDVILDNPFEDDLDLVATLNVLKQVPKPFQLQIFSLMFYPGTEIYNMYKEKFGPSVNPENKNYMGYETTYLNKLIRVSPLIAGSWIDYFAAHKDSAGARGLFNLIYVFLSGVVEPVSFFYLMLKSFQYSLSRTFKITLPTFKTKIRDRLIKV